MLLLLWKAGRFPAMSRKAFRESGILGRLWRLVLPGMIGGAALQISFLVDRALAICLGPKAVPALNYVDRIIDLPIGIYAIALGSVLTATMSRAAARGNLDEISHDLTFSLRHVYFLCVPMGGRSHLFLGTDDPHPLSRRKLYRRGPHGRPHGRDLLRRRNSGLLFDQGASRTVQRPQDDDDHAALFADRHRLQHRAEFDPDVAPEAGGIALSTVLASMLNNTLLLRHLQKEGIPLGSGSIIRTFARSGSASRLPPGRCFTGSTRCSASG